MNYKTEYITQKRDYLRLKTTFLNKVGGADNKKDIIIIVGYGASGKSHLSKHYARNGYFVISGDDIIKDKLVSKDNSIKHYAIYEIKTPKYAIDSKLQFIKIVKKLVNKHKKIVIEGQFKNIKMINEMVGGREYSVILTKPKNMKSYIKNLTTRFVSDPANYGRIGHLQIMDNTNGRLGLNDYIKNGITGKYIQNLIKKCAKARYYKHQEVLDYYTKIFKNLTVKLT